MRMMAFPHWSHWSVVDMLSVALVPSVACSYSFLFPTTHLVLTWSFSLGHPSPESRPPVPLLYTYSLDFFGFGVYPVAQGERPLATWFPAPFEGTETYLSLYHVLPSENVSPPARSGCRERAGQHASVEV